MLNSSLIKYYLSLANNFAVLGLKTNVKFIQVKKKYYQLAKMYHPDINKTEDTDKKFTEITKAYKYIVENYDKQKEFGKIKQPKQTQSNDSKFKNQKRQKTKMEQDDYQDFHQYDTFFKHSKKFRKPRLGEDIYINLNIMLEQSVTGVSKQFTYTRYEPCIECASKAFTACFSCGGKGEVYDRANRQKIVCQYCSGKGFKNECASCLGASYVLREVKDQIYIDKGTQDKTILKVEKKGHSGYKANNGDLYVTVLVGESEKFKIDGNNIHSQLQLDFVTAVCGGITKIQTVHGKKEIKIEQGTQSGSEIRLFNFGIKSPYSKRMGDQIVKVKIKIPTNLSRKQKDLLRKLYEVQNQT